MCLGHQLLQLIELSSLWPIRGLILHWLVISRALVETAGQTDLNFKSWTPRRVYIQSGGPNVPSITVSSEIEPYYRDPVSTLFQVLILHPLPHWQVVLGAIAYWDVLSPK